MESAKEALGKLEALTSALRINRSFATRAQGGCPCVSGDDHFQGQGK
jgi:hypothetical protein